MPAIEDFLNTPPSTVKLDPTTSGLITDLTARSQRTTPGIIAGADQSQFNDPTLAARHGTALGGQDQTDSVLSALGARNSKNSTDFVNNLKSKIELNAPVREMKGAQQALGNLNAGNEIQQTNYKIQKQQWMNEQRVKIYRQQQQQSILASILGIVGTIGGAVIGSFAGSPGAGAVIGGSAAKLAGGK